MGEGDGGDRAKLFQLSAPKSQIGRATPHLNPPAPLARLRGFAGGKAGFTIFLVRKYLIWNVWATGNIVKKACSENLPDSQGIVFVIESTSLCSFEEPNGGR
ncbi:MAG TPA: hypothetical protein VJY34_22410, partial [Roseiarcus sp.]|nr:hypothetical protein [Roseiarcus sp.]